MIYGGFGSGWLSDGALVDTNQKKVVQRLSAGDFKFDCFSNYFITTEYGAVVAIANANNSFKLIEISTTDFSVRVMQDLD